MIDSVLSGGSVRITPIIFLRLTFPFAVLLALFFFAAQDDGLRSLAASPYMLVASLALGQLGLFFFGLRLKAVLTSIGVQTSTRKVMAIHFESLLLYFILPASLGQDASRAGKIFAHQTTERRSLSSASQRAVSTSFAIIVDRIVGVATLMSIALLAIPNSVLASTSIWEASWWLFAVVIAILFMGAGVFVAVWRYANSIWSVARQISWSAISRAAIASALGQVLIGLAVLMPVVGANLPVALADILVILAVATAGQLIPVSFAGVGAGEIASYWLYVAVGLSSKEALLPVAALYGLHLFGALLGGISEISKALQKAHQTEERASTSPLSVSCCATEKARIVIVTAQNMASTNVTRPLIEKMPGEIATVLILNNFPLSNWKDVTAFYKLTRRCGWQFLVFKFAEIWIHYLLSLLRRESIAQLCRANGVRYMHFSKARDDGFAQALRVHEPDYLISTGPAILPSSVINSPRIATLNCHGADLPTFRGPANYIWTLLENQTERTVTIHRMHPRIDSGPIWRKRKYPVNSNWTVYEYNFNHTLDGGAFLHESLVDILENGPDEEIEQNELDATIRTFPNGEDMRRLRQKGITILNLRDIFRCLGSKPTNTKDFR